MRRAPGPTGGTCWATSWCPGLWALALLVVVLPCLVQLAPACAAQPLRLASGEWPPYFSEQLRHYGVGSHIVSEAFALEGIEVEYGFFPWKRSLRLAREGVWDGTLGWEPSAERERFFYISDRVWQAPWVFFHLKSSPFDWQDFGDLAEVRIGGTLGYIYSQELFEAERAGKLHIERTVSDRLNLRKLASGRIDVFPQLVDIGYYQLRQLFDADTLRRFTHHRKPLGSHLDHLLLTRADPRNAELIRVFNRGLAALKASGRYGQFFVELRRGEYGPAAPDPGTATD